MDRPTGSTFAWGLVALAIAAGCGGAPGNASGTGPAPAPAALPPGSSGYPGVDWGDTMEAVQADYPAATAAGDELVLRAPHAGEPAVTSFMFTGDQLIAIDVAYDQVFPSMEACAETYHRLRAELARTLGETGDDNLGSFWTTDSASISLTCNPEGEDGQPASLGMSYTLPEPEDVEDEGGYDE